jgi:hypothetical protein
MITNDFKVVNGDLVIMRKQHPCGGNQWKIIRFGADVKIECQTCGKVVMLDRVKFYKQVKKVLKDE